MQLETMQYFDSTMRGAPPYSSDYATHLKWALCDKKEAFYADDINGQILSFKDKHGMNEYTIYTFSSGSKAVRSRVEILDSSRVYVVNPLPKGELAITIDQFYFQYNVDSSGNSDFQHPSYERFGFKIKHGGNGIVFYVGSSSDSVGAYILQSQIANPRWCVMCAEDMYMFIVESEENVFRGVVMIREQSGKYWVGGMVCPSYENSAYGTRLNYAIDILNGNIIWANNPVRPEIMVLGGGIRNYQLNLSSVENGEDYEILPSFSQRTLRKIPYFLVANTIISQVDGFQTQHFSDALILYFHVGSNNNLIIEW